MGGILPRLGHGGLQLLLHLGQALVQLAVVLRRRPRPAPQGGAGKAVLLQYLLTGLFLALMAQKRKIAQLRIPARPQNLGQVPGGGQSPLQRPRVHPGGHRPELHRHLMGGGRLQGNVQLQPGGQGELLGAQLVLLGVEGPDGPLQAVEGSRAVQGGGVSSVVKEPGLGHRRPGLNHGQRGAFFLGRVFGQGSQRRLGAGFGLPGPGQRGRVRPGERSPFRVLLPVLRLADLHAAHVLKQPQQLLPLVAHPDQPQPLHLDDGHQLFTTLLTML